MIEVTVRIRKCKNGYYIRIYDGLWGIMPQRFIASSDEEVTEVLKPFLKKLGEA